MHKPFYPYGQQSTASDGNARPQIKPAALLAGIPSDYLDDRACAQTIDAAFYVHEVLGAHHAPDTYKNALIVELQHRQIKLHQNASFSVVFRNKIVGSFIADILVEERILIQVVNRLTQAEGRRHDMLRGLAAGGLKVGLSFCFGDGELSFARIL